MPLKDPEKRAEYRAAYTAAHREEKAKYDAAYRAAHRKEIAEYKAAHREEAAVYMAMYNATYHAAHREEAAAYYAAHKEEIAVYSAWCHMIQRCTDPKNNRYKYYGALGVRVARHWLTFTNFLEDMGPRPSPQHSLSRIADSGDYKPGNVVWGDRKHQLEQRKIKKQKSEYVALYKATVSQEQVCQM